MFNKEIAEFLMEHPNTDVTIKYSEPIVGGPGITIRIEMRVYDDAGRIVRQSSESRTIHVSEFDLAEAFFETTYPMTDILKNLYLENPDEWKTARMH